MDAVKFVIEHGVWPAMERLKGNQIRANLRELQATERISPEAMQELRVQKLKKLLLYCLEHVPAYREFGDLAPLIESDPVAALARFPITTKATVRADAKAYLGDNVPQECLIANRTGGSTGVPMEFFMDRHTVEYYEAARWRGLSWWDISLGSRSVMVWGNPLELDASGQARYRRKERWLKNRIFVPAYNLSAAALDEIIHTIQRFRPEYLYGYASALAALAQLMERAGKRLNIRLKAVVSTSETLQDWQREVITRVFGCAVANEYGARDAGILAYSCPEGGLHLSAENVWIEFIDPLTGQPAEPGNEGFVAVTDLNNFCMPRLRYRLEDMSGWAAPRQCRCGRVMPLILPVQGREDSMLQRVDGGLVHGHAILQVLRDYLVVRQCQLVQDRPDHATLRLILEPDASGAEEAVQEALSRIQALLPGTEIEVERCNEIPPSPSGKIRYTIRTFPLELP